MVSNKQFATTLVDKALNAPAKIGEPLGRASYWRGVTRRQYDTLKGLVEEALDQRDECREAAIKSMIGFWMDRDHLAYPLGGGTLERLDQVIVPGVGVFYQLDRQAAEDWFDAVRDGHVIALERGNNG